MPGRRSGYEPTRGTGSAGGSPDWRQTRSSGGRLSGRCSGRWSDVSSTAWRRCGRRCARKMRRHRFSRRWTGSTCPCGERWTSEPGPGPELSRSRSASRTPRSSASTSPRRCSRRLDGWRPASSSSRETRRRCPSATPSSTSSPTLNMIPFLDETARVLRPGGWTIYAFSAGAADADLRRAGAPPPRARAARVHGLCGNYGWARQRRPCPPRARGLTSSALRRSWRGRTGPDVSFCPARLAAQRRGSSVGRAHG